MQTQAFLGFTRLYYKRNISKDNKKRLLSVIKYSAVAKIMDGASMVVCVQSESPEKLSVLLSKLPHPSSSSPRVPLLHVLHVLHDLHVLHVLL